MLRSVFLAVVLVFGLVGNVCAEGFNLNEWSARGFGLAGGLVGRADDASALAYNAAGITQLPGTHLMIGGAIATPYGSINNTETGESQHNDVNTWSIPHFYATHQLNDNWWIGLGLFTRFGLGNGFPTNWFGRYSITAVGMESLSAVPTVAYKINDMFSVSLGLEVTYLSMYLSRQVPQFGIVPGVGPGYIGDNHMQIDGESWAIGGHLGLHARLSDQWSVGFAYKTQTVHHFHGKARFDRQYVSPIPLGFQRQVDSPVESVERLPDSFALGICYKPLENLSFEVGATWTRWSTYNHLNIYFDGWANYSSIADKNWQDNWSFNVSVEYKPTDWLALRAGYWHETPVVSAEYADYIVPSNGRHMLTLGAGFYWDNWTVDLAYGHEWVNKLSFNTSLDTNVYRGYIDDLQADIFMVSIGYSF